MHLHLDLTGGIAGDMFVAAMLDAFDELQAPLLAAMAPLAEQHHFTLSLERSVNGGIAGSRFHVKLAQPTPAHAHYHWRDIRKNLEQSGLAADVRQHAIGIFSQLAQAEAKVHGVHEDEVAFHEVGAWDCIADIIASAWLIVHSGATSWSSSTLPWGGGHIQCAHGFIPVPAPATVNLLKGFEFVDDGIKGERITPTGAAILAWLQPQQTVVSGSLQHSGFGLGTKQFVGLPNVLRVTALQSNSATHPSHQHQQLAIIQCDIDDMSGEMLAIAREQLRAHPDVLEITEAVAHGKKQRFIQTLTLLCQPSAIGQICDAIFLQTSTLGVRYWLCHRVSLTRQETEIDGHSVKQVMRPDGSMTQKLAADELAQLTNYAARQQLKRSIEQHQVATPSATIVIEVNKDD